MPIECDMHRIRLLDVVSVEEAENLLGWLQKAPEAKLDLSACTHLHPANLQVIMAGKAQIAAWPNDTNLYAWLKTTLEAK